MRTFIVTPCLLGFEVRITEHHSERAIGVMDFSNVLQLLMRNWKLDFTVEVR